MGNEDNKPNVVKNDYFIIIKFIITIGSLLLVGVSSSIISSFMNNNQENGSSCNVDLFVREGKNNYEEITMYDSDAQTLCTEWNKVKGRNLGDRINVSRRFVLVINGDEIVLDPYNREYSYDGRFAIFSHKFLETINIYIDHVSLTVGEDDLEYAGNLSFNELITLKMYFLDKEYKVIKMQYDLDYNYFMYINGEAYHFENFDGLIEYDGNIIEVDSNIIELIKKAYREEVLYEE